MKLEPKRISVNGEDFFELQSDHAVLLEHRKHLGLTQQQVANLCQISVRQYQRYETGEKSIYSASFQIGVRICRCLQIEINDFFPGEFTENEEKAVTLTENNR